MTLFITVHKRRSPGAAWILCLSCGQTCQSSGSNSEGKGDWCSAPASSDWVERGGATTGPDSQSADGEEGREKRARYLAVTVVERHSGNQGWENGSSVKPPVKVDPERRLPRSTCGFSLARVGSRTGASL